MRRGAALILVLALMATACSDDTAEDTAPESTTFVTVSITTTTTEPTFPNGPAFLVADDRGPYVYALQEYLNCGGHAELTVDGVFGPATVEAVSGVQATALRDRTGEPDEDTFHALSRACDAVRSIEFADDQSVAAAGGSVGAEDPERFTVSLVAGWDATFRLDVTAAEIAVTGADGDQLHVADGSQEVSVTVPRSQAYEITVLSGESLSYILEVEVPVRAISDEEPVETDTVDVMLDFMFGAVASGDLANAMTAVGSEVGYHPLGEETREGEAGRSALLASLSRLAAEQFSWVSLGVDRAEGDVVTFGVTDGTADPIVVLFAGRLRNGVFVEWWDQPDDVETTLAAMFDRALADDPDGVMTLLAEEVTFHSDDGTIVSGTDGRATLLAALTALPRVFDEVVSYEAAVARFRTTEIAADPDGLLNQARFDIRIVEWWENPNA